MKFKHTIAVIICFIVTFYCSTLIAQGCVAIRSFTACSGNIGAGASLLKGEFQVGMNYRYFKSFRHFRGSHEETHRIEEGTQVINNSHFLDFSLNYGITNRWYANIILPFVLHKRSSMYEHGGNPSNGLGERHITSSRGISDLRLGVGYWLINPEKHKKFNFAIGIGAKLPTGNYDYMDTFYNQGENREEDLDKVVDQSIQPGDGGWGITFDVQGYYLISNSFMLNTNLYYLINPQKTNGALTRNGSSEFSCPDQYAVRLGVFYMTPVQGVSLYLGSRLEGVPSSDLIGSSEGYRRPGYAISIEPGANYDIGNISLNFTVPVALYRNRIQSYSDKQRTEETGVYRHGDAAFADYLINFSASYRFGGKVPEMEMHDTY